MVPRPGQEPGRLAGYEDVNDAARLARDPAMRAIVGREGLDRPAATTSEMGRFETGWLATEANVNALVDLSGIWIDRVHERRPPDGIILDMDSSESPTHGQQEGSAWNGHFGCTCYHPLFVFNQPGDLDGCALPPGNAPPSPNPTRAARAGGSAGTPSIDTAVRGFLHRARTTTRVTS